MTLLDRLRRRPAWENPDPEARAEAVRALPADQQELLAEIARGDSDARVRRAAVRKLLSTEALAGLLRDEDESVRREATDALIAVAAGHDVERATAAVAALVDPRELLALARTAPTGDARRAALDRLTEPRHLATLAKVAEDAAVRNGALRRLTDPALLVDVALKSDHKDTATGAVERIEDVDALRAVEARARHKAATRRARTRLFALGVTDLSTADEPPPAEATAPPVDSIDEAGETPAPAPAAADAVVEAAPAEPPAVAAVPTARPTPEPPAPAPVPVSPPVPPAHPPETPSGVAAAEQRRAALAQVEALCARIEGLTRSEGLTRREAEAALRESREPEHAPGVPGKLRQRLREARAALFARVQELREADEWSRWGNATVQEALCRRMESLVPREDLERVAQELRECDHLWAEFRQAPRDEAVTLRERYQAARAQVKARLDAYFAKKAADEAENLRRKEALCERAETLADSTDWLRTSEELKALQAQWKEIGPVPRHRAEAAWQRFRGACDRFFTRRDEDRKRRDQEHAANLVRKLALCAQAETFAESTDWDAAAAEIRRLQAEWRTVGPVAKKKSEAVWQRFRGACDRFFDRYKRRDELETASRKAVWEALCGELEGLIPAAEPVTAPDALAATVSAVFARARQAPALPKTIEDALRRRLAEARDKLIAAFPQAFRGTDLDPELARARREKLIARVEALAAAAEAGSEALAGEALARRLKEALAANTIGGAGDAEARRRQEAQEVESAQAAWKKLGPVPGEAGAALEDRFRRACDRFYRFRKAGPRPVRPAQVTR
jgi:hypothetical protein